MWIKPIIQFDRFVSVKHVFQLHWSICVSKTCFSITLVNLCQFNKLLNYICGFVSVKPVIQLHWSICVTKTCFSITLVNLWEINILHLNIIGPVNQLSDKTYQSWSLFVLVELSKNFLQQSGFLLKEIAMVCFTSTHTNMKSY